MSDFSVIVQGCLHPRIREAICAYSKIGDVIVSYWEGDDETIIDGLNVIRVKNPVPLIDGVFNNQNIYFQTISTLGGLKAVKTKHVIKVRCDESFKDLKPIVDKVREHPEKYTCLDIYFRAFKLYGVHPSDHLIGGATERLTEMFEILKAHLDKWHHEALTEINSIMSSNTYISVRDIKDNTFIGATGDHDRYNCPETMIGDAFLRTHDVDPNTATAETVKEYFQMGSQVQVGFVNKNGDLGAYDDYIPQIHSMDDV